MYCTFQLAVFFPNSSSQWSLGIRVLALLIP